MADAGLAAPFVRNQALARKPSGYEQVGTAGMRLTTAVRLALVVSYQLDLPAGATTVALLALAVPLTRLYLAGRKHRGYLDGSG
jgi:hypothetical protein